MSQRPNQRRYGSFVERHVAQLTARSVMDGPDALFAGKENMIEGVFRTLESLEPAKQSIASQTIGNACHYYRFTLVFRT
jgi:hypothetical protein